MIEIDTAGKSGSVDMNIVGSSGAVFIKNYSDTLAERVVEVQKNVAFHRQFEMDGCRRVEGVRVRL